jgi:hypothetical protein
MGPMGAHVGRSFCQGDEPHLLAACLVYTMPPIISCRAYSGNVFRRDGRGMHHRHHMGVHVGRFLCQGNMPHLLAGCLVYTMPLMITAAEFVQVTPTVTPKR